MTRRAGRRRAGDGAIPLQASAGTVAIDRGRASPCTATDPRGFARAGAACDLGAVEVGATAPTPGIFIDGFE